MAQQTLISAIAITGGMGSGKSSVSAYLCESGGFIPLSSDGICRQLLEPGASGWLAMREAFGERFFRDDQHLDRPLLRAVLFEDHEFRDKLNALLHPLVRNMIAERIEGEAGRHLSAGVFAPRFVVEVPLLYEAGWEHDFARVVVVYANRDTCVRRIMRRDLVSDFDAEKAMGAQMLLEHKSLLADHVIDNNGPWSETCLQILHLRHVLWSADGFPGE